MMIRHGDLILTPTKNKGLKSLGKFGSFVLALGETTGHKHLLVAEKTTQFEVFKDNEGRFVLKLNNPATISHEEHNTITIMPDTYVVGNEQEYNYFELEAQKVID